MRKLISFDWALKRLLRSKANFGVLEGFLSELLEEEITILEVLESESNKDTRRDKYNRVDLKVKDSRERILLVELQYERELDYLQRLLYGSSRVVVEHLKQGAPYLDVKKVISISIMHFDLGQGKDYVYHGTTRFMGIHYGDELSLDAEQKAKFSAEKVSGLYPEYYLLKVKRFDELARNTLDEWIYFLKTGEIRESFTAKGLKEAKEKLDVLGLDEQERAEYEAYDDDLHFQASMVESTYGSGKWEGEQIGLGKGLKEGEQIGLGKGLKEGEQIGLGKGLKEGEQIGLGKGLKEGQQIGEEMGLLKGQEIGRRNQAGLVVALIQRRLSTLDEGVAQRVRALPFEALERLAMDLFDFTDQEVLIRWLDGGSAERFSREPGPENRPK